VIFDRIRNGFPVGLIVGAATAGALVGLGARHGSAFLPFELGGRALLASWRITTPSPGAALAAGILSHSLWMLLWGVCFSVAASRLRGAALLAGSLLFALTLGALSSTVVPGALGAAAFAALSVAQTTFVLLLLAGALIAGVAIGRSPR